MTGSNFKKKLVVLSADKDIHYTVKTLLEERQPALSIKINMQGVDMYTHPQKDPGCRTGAVDFLKPFVGDYHHALVIFDHDGCGKEKDPANDIENELEEKLSKSGWASRAAVICIDPEVENWVWTDSPNAAKAMGWEGQMKEIYSWLREKNFLKKRDGKPADPKEAFKQALRHKSKSPSPRIFQEIARGASVNNCVDPAFNKLKEKLHKWFPAPCNQ